MLYVFRQDNHFPGRCKNSFIALRLPKLNIELLVSRFSTHNPCLEVSFDSLIIFGLQEISSWSQVFGVFDRHESFLLIQPKDVFVR